MTCLNLFFVVYCYSLYYFMSFTHDVMHEVFAVTCVVHMRSGAWTACCAVLSWLLTGLLSPVSCPLFLGRHARHLSLGSIVTTSQVSRSFQSTTYVTSHHGGCDCWAFGTV